MKGYRDAKTDSCLYFSDGTVRERKEGKGETEEGRGFLTSYESGTYKMCCSLLECLLIIPLCSELVA